MIRTQIQLPDALLLRARTYAAHEEISLAEVVRHALDAFLSSIAPAADFRAPKTAEWHLPSIRGAAPLRDPFEDEDWRYNLHLGDSGVADFVAEDAAAVRPAPGGDSLGAPVSGCAITFSNFPLGNA